jgi:hypothetical protein
VDDHFGSFGPGIMRCISVASRPRGRALEFTGRHPGPARDATCLAPRCPQLQVSFRPAVTDVASASTAAVWRHRCAPLTRDLARGFTGSKDSYDLENVLHADDNHPGRISAELCVAFLSRR